MIEPKYIWRYEQPLEEQIETVSTHFHIAPITAKVLINRGLTQNDDIERFLNPSRKGFHDPFRMKGLSKAVDRIIQARVKNEKIIIYGDYDVDGVTSTSILYLFLKEHGWNVGYYIPDRIEEGYGLNNEAVKKIKDMNTDLVITVDTGIAAVEEVKYGQDLGLDMIVTDHHECQEQIPAAYAVIDPKQEECEYPFDMLAGVGVTFKLIHGIAIKMGEEKSIWKYLDIVAIGTVADVVPLVDENRIIVKSGFETIPNTWNVGLRALLDVAGYKEGDPVTSNLIGYRIGPRLNAAGRLGDAKRGVKLFTTDSLDEATTIAKELDEENKNRQAMEQAILEEALEIIEKEIDLDQTKVIVVASEKWHHGVIGIVASRIMEKYYRPTILMCIEDGEAKGSARSVEGFSIFHALTSTSEYLERFGGHEMAAGLAIKVENLDAFRQAINRYATEVMEIDTLIPKLKLDGNLEEDRITLDLISELERLEPYGPGNPEPMFSFGGSVEENRGVGKEGNHLKIKIMNSNTLLEGIGFGLGECCELLNPKQEIRLAGSLERNEWNGLAKPQIMVRDIQSSEAEIVEDQYYISLYNMLKGKPLESIKIEAFEKDIIRLEAVDKSKDTVILVNTLEAYQKVVQEQKIKKEKHQHAPKMYYNWNQNKYGKYDIIVNPMVDRMDLSKYHTIIVYDYPWTLQQQEELEKVNQRIWMVNQDRTIHQRQLEAMIPKREDFAMIYRQLKRLEAFGQDKIGINKMKAALKKDRDVSIFKILACMDVFQELDLVQYTFERGKIQFVCNTEKKTSLENSNWLKQLKKFLYHLSKNLVY